MIAGATRSILVGARRTALIGVCVFAIVGLSDALIGSSRTATGAQEPSLAQVLTRASIYVIEYQRQLSGIVAEESYLQTFRARFGVLPIQRELQSDVLLVRPPGADRYVQFRDVFEVDGMPVRDRQERLTRLFLDPSLSGMAQMRRIMEESARYNIGNIERTMNVPVLALLFLDPAYQPRFRFSRTTDTIPDTLREAASAADPAAARFRTSTEVWAIEYRETGRGTVIRTTSGQDLPATGRFWIEPATGRLEMSELAVGDSRVQGLVDVTYEFEPSLGLSVPAAMRERYVNPRTTATVEGSAHYSRFRRFDVRVEDAVRDPVP